MFTTTPAKDRHFTDFGWLQTYWLFSFSNYHDPNNINHGSLRVFNDDIVQPQKGFGRHPHEEMEIVSIVLDGVMEHQDTMGNKNVIETNDVQRMSAGTGLHHSEWNHGDIPVKFFQIWILPNQRGLSPSYDQKSFSPGDWHNRFALLAAEGENHAAVSLNTDASIYRSSRDAERTTTFEVDPTRKQFLYLIEGEATVNNTQLQSRDQARIVDERKLEIKANTDIDLLLIDIPRN